MKKQNLQLLFNKYKLIAENSQEMIIFFNQHGDIIDCNGAARAELGFEEDINDIKISDIFQKAIRLENKKVIINTRYQDKTAESVAYRLNQTCFAVELRITVAEGIFSFLGICSAVNISEKKKLARDLKHAKNELKSSLQIKNEFLANITHELKTPVNGIMGMTENLLETELTPKQLETVNIIYRCCNNMSTIINDILDFTKFDNNKLVLERREFDFRMMINNMIKVNINRINEKGLKLIVNVADDIPNQVIGDELRLTQILNNLFSNAIKFTAIGQIALEVVKTAQSKNDIELFFMVMDTGIGIGPDEKDKLFHSFSQVDGSITRRFGGTGLGLSICRMLVQAMHGSISVDSEKNKGSTFSFSIRLSVSEESKPSEAKADKLPGNSFIEQKSLHKAVLRRQPETDYVGKLLEEAGLSNLRENSIGPDPSASDADSEGSMPDLNGLIEKLVICIEMESWEKAEEMAAFIKKQMPIDNTELKNKALQLVLSVRKEEHDNSMDVLRELEKLINEVM